MSVNNVFSIHGCEFKSRLLVGTGKFSSGEIMAETLLASGTEIVTVALRRIDWSNNNQLASNILNFIDKDKYLIIANTSGAHTAEEAIRLAHLAESSGLPKWIKLEIHPDPRYLLPDPIETFKAAEYLVKEGFVVLPYINADPVLAKRLEDVGVSTIMPLGSPIGSNRGLENRAQISIIVEQVNIPVIVDAGLGLTSHIAEAIELGVDAVLINTAIAIARDPIQMAKAFRLALDGSILAFNAGSSPYSNFAQPTSPLTAFLKE